MINDSYYLLTRKFQGDLNISSMRIFTDPKRIRPYIKRSPIPMDEWFVYKVYDSEEGHDAKLLPEPKMIELGLRSKKSGLVSDPSGLSEQEEGNEG